MESDGKQGQEPGEGEGAPDEAPPPAAGPTRRRSATLPGVRPPRRKLARRVARIVRDAENRAAASTRRRVRVALWMWRLLVQITRQWIHDRCPQQAASLAFQTLLSMVPALAVCLAAFRATGQFEAESALVEFLSERLIPVSPEEIARHLTAWSENITFESLGLIGLVATVILAFIMFNNLERVMNFMWRVEKRRSLTQKFVIFYAAATIGPFLIGTSIVQAAKVGLTHGFAGYLLSFLASYLALFLVNFFLPAVKVKVVPAAIGALLTTVLFELAKHAFNHYVSGYAFSRFSGIYGAVAVLPLFLVWIYWSWLILLLGVACAHAMQNIHFLDRIERRGPTSLENELLGRLNGNTAARVMVAAAEAYIRGEKVISRRQLADRLDLSHEALDRLIARLVEADLLLQVDGEVAGLLPARPPQEISLSEVLGLFRGNDLEPDALGETALDRILVQLDADADARTRTLTLADLAGTEHPAARPRPKAD